MIFCLLSFVLVLSNSFITLVSANFSFYQFFTSCMCLLEKDLISFSYQKLSIIWRSILVIAVKLTVIELIVVLFVEVYESYLLRENEWNLAKEISSSKWSWSSSCITLCLILCWLFPVPLILKLRSSFIWRILFAVSKKVSECIIILLVGISAVFLLFSSPLVLSKNPSLFISIYFER